MAFSLKDILEGIESFPDVAVAGHVDFENLFDETRNVFFDHHNILVAPKIPLYSTIRLNGILLEMEDELGPDYIMPCAISKGVMAYGKLYFSMQPDKEVEHYQYGIVTLIPNSSLAGEIKERVSNREYIALGQLDLKKLIDMKKRDKALRKH